MKISVFLAHLLETAEQRKMSLTQVMLAAQREGITHVECHLPDLEKSEISEALRTTGMQVGGIYVFYDKQEDEEAYTTRLLTQAQTWHAVNVMPIPGFVREGEDRDLAKQAMAERMNRICDRAQKLGISVVLEDFGENNAPYGTVEELQWMFSQVPLLDCVLDTGNFRAFGQDLMWAYGQLKDKVRHVHLKDWLLTPSQGGAAEPAADGQTLYPSAIGSGILPLRECIQALAEDGYEGIMAIEHFGLRDQWMGIRQSAAFVRECIEK